MSLKLIILNKLLYFHVSQKNIHSNFIIFLWGRTHGRNLPKEVVFAIEFSFSREAFLCKVTFALAALYALDVPCSVQNIKEKPVQYRPLAARTVDHRLWMCSHSYCRGVHNLRVCSCFLSFKREEGKGCNAEGCSKSVLANRFERKRSRSFKYIHHFCVRGWTCSGPKSRW